MYDELVKRLRASVDGRYEKCDGCPYEEDYPCCVDCLDKMHKQAADAIEKLTEDNTALNGTVSNLIQQIAELNKPRWIPVTEALPELHDAEYLDEVTGEMIRYKESNPIMIWLENGGFMDIGIYEKSDAVDDFCYQGVPATVTYWIPLPEPPKEGET